MSNMKCPFCQQELKELHVNGFSVGFRCKNKNCPETSIMCGTKALWQELIRTRKALDVLLFTINRLENQNYKDCAWHLRLAIAKIEATGIADKAIEQITALEQKDVK